MEHCNDFRYDLKVGQIAEKAVAEILENATVEVKRDLQWKNTGNVFIEYKSRGKKSGLAKSQADWWCFYLGSSVIFINTLDLKRKVTGYMGTSRDIVGGDNNTSKGVLLPVTELL